MRLMLRRGVCVLSDEMIVPSAADCRWMCAPAWRAATTSRKDARNTVANWTVPRPALLLHESDAIATRLLVSTDEAIAWTGVRLVTFGVLESDSSYSKCRPSIHLR